MSSPTVISVVVAAILSLFFVSTSSVLQPLLETHSVQQLSSELDSSYSEGRQFGDFFSYEGVMETRISRLQNQILLLQTNGRRLEALFSNIRKTISTLEFNIFHLRKRLISKFLATTQSVPTTTSSPTTTEYKPSINDVATDSTKLWSTPTATSTSVSSKVTERLSTMPTTSTASTTSSTTPTTSTSSTTSSTTPTTSTASTKSSTTPTTSAASTASSTTPTTSTSSTTPTTSPSSTTSSTTPTTSTASTTPSTTPTTSTASTTPSTSTGTTSTISSEPSPLNLTETSVEINMEPFRSLLLEIEKTDARSAFPPTDRTTPEILTSTNLIPSFSKLPFIPSSLPKTEIMVKPAATPDITENASTINNASRANITISDTTDKIYITKINAPTIFDTTTEKSSTKDQFSITVTTADPNLLNSTVTTKNTAESKSTKSMTTNTVLLENTESAIETAIVDITTASQTEAADLNTVRDATTLDESAMTDATTITLTISETSSEATSISNNETNIATNLEEAFTQSPTMKISRELPVSTQIISSETTFVTATLDTTTLVNSEELATSYTTEADITSELLSKNTPSSTPVTYTDITHIPAVSETATSADFKEINESYTAATDVTAEMASETTDTVNIRYYNNDRFYDIDDEQLIQ